jgi:hypothetical protein
MHILRNYKSLIFPILLFIPVVILSVLGIHGSSIGIYNQFFYGPDYKDPNLLFGEVRPVRSDEYTVSTPWALAQVKNGLEEPNTLYLASQDISISDAPTDNWAGLFEPQNWGFLILPVEQAFAFRWWIKAFLLTVAAYMLFMMISKNDIAVSIMAALSLTFSPFIQWWYSTSVTEITSYGLFAFIFFLKLMNDRKWVTKVIDSLLLIFFAVCFALTLYPPFQIPFAILLLVAGMGYLFTRLPAMRKRDVRNLALNMGLIVVSIGLILAFYYISNQNAFQALAGTVYPGIRESRGGDMMPFKALAGFYNVQLQANGRKIPSILNHNQSEAASFFFFSLFLLPFFLYHLISSVVHKEPIDWPLSLTIVLLCVLLVWGVVGFPARLARMLLLNHIDSYRMLFMFGVANHLLMLYYLYRVKINLTTAYKIAALLYSLGVAIIIYVIGRDLRAIEPDYIGSTIKILSISSAAGIMMFLLLYQKGRLFFGLFLAFTLLSTYYVNPLYRGLSPLLGSRVSEAIQQIQQENPRAGWVVYGDFMFGNYLAANGAHVLNGTYYYPNLKFWSQFDPDHRYEKIYNRYAHILVSPADNSKIKFKLQQNDLVQMNISPCSPVLDHLGIKYYLFFAPPLENTCLSKVSEIDYPKLSIYIFKSTD